MNSQETKGQVNCMYSYRAATIQTLTVGLSKTDQAGGYSWVADLWPCWCHTCQVSNPQCLLQYAARPFCAEAHNGHINHGTRPTHDQHVVSTFCTLSAHCPSKCCPYFEVHTRTRNHMLAFHVTTPASTPISGPRGSNCVYPPPCRWNPPTDQSSEGSTTTPLAQPLHTSTAPATTHFRKHERGSKLRAH